MPIGTIIAGLLGAGGAVGSSALSSNKSGGSPKIPTMHRGPTQEVFDNSSDILNNPATPYLLPRVAPMSPFEVAALGGIANQALTVGAPGPTTTAPVLRPPGGG